MLGSRNEGEKDQEERKWSFTLADVNTLKEHTTAFTGLDASVYSSTYPGLGHHGVFENWGLQVTDLSWLVGLLS